MTSAESRLHLCLLASSAIVRKMAERTMLIKTEVSHSFSSSCKPINRLNVEYVLPNDEVSKISQSFSALLMYGQKELDRLGKL